MRFALRTMVLLVALTALRSAAAEHRVPLFLSALDSLQRQTFVRVINHSKQSGQLRIEAFDDSGRRFLVRPIVLDGDQVLHFNSDDLEDGNAAKGISGIGAGEGDWRLVISSDLDVEVLAYIRTQDGFVTAMHDMVSGIGNRHRLPMVNPGSNVRQVSQVRLINSGEEDAELTIRGFDFTGKVSGIVTVILPDGVAKTFTSAELEAGGPDFRGALGDGTDKWELFVESSVPIEVMSLLATPTGHLTNLSTTPRPPLLSDFPGASPDLIATFDLAPENSFPTGIAFFNEHFYVLNYGGTVIAYTADGERNAAADLTLTYERLPGFGYQPLRNVVGIASKGRRMYVFHEDRVRAFSLLAEPNEAASFAAHSGHGIRDIAIGPTRFYFAGAQSFSNSTEILVYDLDGTYQSTETLLGGADSPNPLAVAFDARTELLYVIIRKHGGFINAFTTAGESVLTAAVAFDGVANIGAATIVGEAIYVLDDVAATVHGFPLRR